MKIAFIGQKGFPATIGGVEHHVDRLSRGLAARGHQVTVFSRRWYNIEPYEAEGLHRRFVPSLNTKHLDAISHAFTSTLDALRGDFDIVHYQAMGPTLLSPLGRCGKAKVVATIHRYDWGADKWGWVAKAVLRLSEQTALFVPHRTIVVARYMRDRYRQGKTVYIPNGVDPPEDPNVCADTIHPHHPNQNGARLLRQEFGLAPATYLLSLARDVPEKRLDWVASLGMLAQKHGLEVVIGGPAAGHPSYTRAGSRSVGFVTGAVKRALLAHAFGYLIPSQIEGLPIALLEAMSYGLPCLASDIPAHVEVVQDGVDGYLFAAGSQARFEDGFRRLVEAGVNDRSALGRRAAETVRRKYDWKDIVRRTEALYVDVLGGF